MSKIIITNNDKRVIKKNNECVIIVFTDHIKIVSYTPIEYSYIAKITERDDFIMKNKKYDKIFSYDVYVKPYNYIYWLSYNPELCIQDNLWDKALDIYYTVTCEKYNIKKWNSEDLEFLVFHSYYQLPQNIEYSEDILVKHENNCRTTIKFPQKDWLFVYKYLEEYYMLIKEHDELDESPLIIKIDSNNIKIVWHLEQKSNFELFELICSIKDEKIEMIIEYKNVYCLNNNIIYQTISSKDDDYYLKKIFEKKNN